MISKETVANALKKLGVEASQLAGDPVLVEQVVNKIYTGIPIPFRWIVGRNRIQRMIASARDKAMRYSGPGNPV